MEIHEESPKEATIIDGQHGWSLSKLQYNEVIGSIAKPSPQMGCQKIMIIAGLQAEGCVSYSRVVAIR